MLFVREELLLGSALNGGCQTPIFSLQGSESFCFLLHPTSGEERVPRGVKGCRGGPRRDNAIILIKVFNFHTMLHTNLGTEGFLARQCLVELLRTWVGTPLRQKNQFASEKDN
ncbi:hypothetical protein TNCV_1565861 [Trichonephila clavipes]|nr:hypothetical protein TNCV_1565861 [Trichonephila clavipes]